MFHFVLLGHGTIRGPDGEVAQVRQGFLSIVPKGAKHDLESDWEGRHEIQIMGPPEGDRVPRLIAGSPDSTDLVIACGLLQVRYGESLGLFDHLREMLSVDLSDSSEMMQAVQGVLEEQSRPGPGSEAMTNSLMTQCMVHAFRRLWKEGDCPLPWLAALEDPRLARTLDEILKDPGVNHTVDSLADAAGMSRSSFSERFTAIFGLSPMSFVHHIRMQRACRLLRQGGQSIEEVASRVGFSSRSHFSRAFKAHTEVPPGAYRG